MTPEERATEVVTQWQQIYVDSGFQSAVTLEELVAITIRAAVAEAVAEEREACAG